MERFADLSHHNAAVDLAAYAAAGHTRVALKATEGTGWTDSTFASRWALAGRLGLRRGAYHFARTATSGGAQADFLLRVVDAAGGMSAGDWLVLDLEDNSSSAAMARAWTFATEFAERMVARGHETGLIYTGRWYATPAGITPGILPPGWRRLWLSDYGTVSDGAVRLPAGWSRDQVAARQYTNAATVPGITGPADYSRIINDWLEDDDMALSADDRKWLQGILLGRESAPDATGDAPVRTVADVAVRVMATGLAGQGNKITRGWTTGDSAKLPVAAQLADQAAARDAGLKALADLVAAGSKDLTGDQVREIVTEAIAAAVVHVQVSVDGTPSEATQ